MSKKMSEEEIEEIKEQEQAWAEAREEIKEEEPQYQPRRKENYLEELRRKLQNSGLPSREKRIILDEFYANPYKFIQPRGFIITPEEIIAVYRKIAEERIKKHLQAHPNDPIFNDFSKKIAEDLNKEKTSS
jgi:hypothetical protein